MQNPDLITLVEREFDGFPVKVQTSREFIAQLSDLRKFGINRRLITEDLARAIGEEIQQYGGDFSPDESGTTLDKLELFLFDYSPAITEERPPIQVPPLKPLESLQGKSGWENCLPLSGDYGEYDLQILNGYCFLH